MASEASERVPLGTGVIRCASMPLHQSRPHNVRHTLLCIRCAWPAGTWSTLQPSTRGTGEEKGGGHVNHLVMCTRVCIGVCKCVCVHSRDRLLTLET